MVSLSEELGNILDELPAWGKAAAFGGVALCLYLPYKWFMSAPRSIPYKKDFQKGIVYLYQFPRSSAVPSLSPFCLKLETWLRMADVPYENINAPFNVRSREGTLPFVEYDGIEYPDSGFAISSLAALLSKDTLESHLNDEQRSISRAFENLAESSLCLSYNQTGRIPNVAKMFALLPPSFSIFGPLVSWIAQRSFVSKILLASESCGIGKHSYEDIIRIGKDDLRAISVYLGSKHYFTGFKPTRIDAALFGMLSQIIYMPFDTAHKTYIHEHCPNLIDFCERIKGRYWPDWEECTKKFSLNTNPRRKTEINKQR
uniref:Failed axon connections homolog n=1 Tax=Steinernema glaseri TaxID=37863 RepID=A0A1I7YZT9_9BILA